ncbi:MAG TPA: hypothetical protein VI522_03815, partial [Gammaproteobacteria bacterium]|nr:hypothetical protein [Gammaproteobacteria bacterium]
RGFSFTAFGVNAVSTVKNNGNAWQALASEDPTLGKAAALLQSQNVAQGLANGWNLGVNAVNTTNTIASGINNNNLGSEALARYGLGGLNGFDPNVTLNMHETHTKVKYQTTGPGELNGKNVVIEADNKISLENGYQVKASEDAHLKANIIEAHAAKLHSSVDRKEMIYSVSGSASTGVTNVGVKRSHDQMKATTHENVGISAGKTMTINAHQVTGNGLNLNAQHYAGNIDNLTLKTMQDTHTASSKSIGINSNGMVSVSNTHEHGKTTNQQSGLHATGDLDNKNFRIGNAHLEGSKITADGQNNLKIDHVTAITQRDEVKSSGFSLTGNVNDVNRLLGHEPPANPNEPGLSRPAIDTVNVSVQRSHQIIEHDVV